MPWPSPFLSKLVPNARVPLREELERHRTRLIVDHASDRWPNVVLQISSDVRQKMLVIPLDEGHGYQKAVLQAPLMAAVHTVYDLPVESGLAAMLQDSRLRSRSGLRKPTQLRHVSWLATAWRKFHSASIVHNPFTLVSSPRILR